MKKLIALSAMAVAGLFMCGLLAAPANAAVDWQKDQKWAMGKEIDLKANATMTQSIERLKDLVKDTTDLTVKKLDCSGNVQYWAVFTVTDVSATGPYSYEVTTKVGVKLSSDFSGEISGALPKAGTYPANDFQLGGGFIGSMFGVSGAPTEEKTVSADMSEDFTFVLTGKTLFDKDLAIINSTWQAKVAFIMSLTGKNVPDINRTEGNVTVAYKDYDIDVRMVATLDLNVDFDPALNIVKPDMKVGDKWTVDSTATVTGKIGGFIDASGLSDEVEKEIFESEFAKNLNATGFPITFDHFTSEDGSITDGHLKPYSFHITADMQCVGKVERNVAGHGNVEVYKVSVNDGEAYFYYSPDAQMVTSMESGSSVPSEISDSLPIDIGVFAGASPSMEMDSVDPAIAESNIASIEKAHASITAQATGSSNIGDFFFKSPFLGLILIVALIIVAVGLVYFLKIRKKT